MFFHIDHGLIVTHTPKSFELIEAGEGYACISWKDIKSIYRWVVVKNKDYRLYPKFDLTRSRDIVGAIVAHYNGPWTFLPNQKVIEV
jgi:uncharacterized protein involved in tolerance to divalent cations